jgi:hypothetical protein
MVGERPLTDSGHEVDNNSGLLFRIAARVAVVVFVGVLVFSLGSGMDPSLALLRALVALLGVSACGWLAEQAVRTQAAPPAPADPVDVDAGSTTQEAVQDADEDDPQAA